MLVGQTAGGALRPAFVGLAHALRCADEGASLVFGGKRARHSDVLLLRGKKADFRLSVSVDLDYVADVSYEDDNEGLWEQ